MTKASFLAITIYGSNRHVRSVLQYFEALLATEMTQYQLPACLPETLFDGMSDCERSKYQEFLNHLVIFKSAGVGGWVPISSKQLKKIAGGTYKRIIRFLKKEGIIEDNDKFSSRSSSPKFKKAFCKSYRLLGKETPTFTPTVAEVLPVTICFIVPTPIATTRNPATLSPSLFHLETF